MSYADPVFFCRGSTELSRLTQGAWKQTAEVLKQAPGTLETISVTAAQKPAPPRKCLHTNTGLCSWPDLNE